MIKYLVFFCLLSHLLLLYCTCYMLSHLMIQHPLSIYSINTRPGTTVFYTNGSLEHCDDDEWRRNLTTKYVDGKLTWTQAHTVNGSTFFSYWPPYTYNRHLKLISDISDKISTRGSACNEYNPTVESLGQTVEGRDIECISIGNGTLNAYIQHRQHPGEGIG